MPIEPRCPTPFNLVTAFILLAALVGTEYSSSRGLALYSPDTGGHFLILAFYLTYTCHCTAFNVFSEYVKVFFSSLLFQLINFSA